MLNQNNQLEHNFSIRYIDINIDFSFVVEMLKDKYLSMIGEVIFMEVVRSTVNKKIANNIMI